MEGCSCALATSSEILGSVVEIAQRMSCSTSRRLRCLDFIYTRAEKADSHNHVEVKGNNFLSTVLLISGYDDATLSQNSVSGKVSNRSRQLESFFKSINWSCNSSSTFSGETRNGFLASNRSSALISGKYDLNSLSSSFRC